MGDNKGCFKFSCFGCLGIVVIIFFVGIAAAVFAGLRPQRKANMEIREYSHRTGELAEVVDLSTVDPRELPELAAAMGATTVDIDLSMGEFFFVPGDEFKVDANIDTANFRLTEKWDEEANQWSVKLRRKGILFGHSKSKHTNRVTITLPRTVPINLNAELAMSESELDLSGIWLKRFEMDTAMGEYNVFFNEPALYPMEYMKVDSSMGDFRFEGLGNASPKQAVFDQAMGALTVNLTGQWRQDSTISIDAAMGEAVIEGPDMAHLDLGDINVALGDRRGSVEVLDLPEGAPTVTVSADLAMGELRIR